MNNLDINKVLELYKKELSDSKHDNILLTAMVESLTEQLEATQKELQAYKDGQENQSQE
jgi:hypothetical protein